VPTLAHRRFLRTEPGEAPLVLEFVKDVFRVSALTVELYGLECVGFFGSLHQEPEFSL
jgi:hypothetical protein